MDVIYYRYTICFTFYDLLQRINVWLKYQPIFPWDKPQRYFMVAEYHGLAEGLYLQERETFLKKKGPVECNPVKEDWKFVRE